MSEEDFKTFMFEIVHSDKISIALTKAGHSKAMIRTVSHLAKKIFNFQWVFLTCPNDTAFITSDTPCFTEATSKFRAGPASPTSTTLFPLSPEICMFVDARTKAGKDLFMNLSKSDTRDINKKIVLNSYEAVVARDRQHLKSLTKNFDNKNHVKKRIKVYEKGDITMFNLES